MQSFLVKTEFTRTPTCAYFAWYNYISIKNGKHFDGHLGCHPVSMQFPNDASLLGFVMYSIPSEQNSKTFLEWFYTRLVIYMYVTLLQNHSVSKQFVLILTMKLYIKQICFQLYKLRKMYF